MSRWHDFFLLRLELLLGHPRPHASNGPHLGDLLEETRPDAHQLVGKLGDVVEIEPAPIDQESADLLEHRELDGQRLGVVPARFLEMLADDRGPHTDLVAHDVLCRVEEQLLVEVERLHVGLAEVVLERRFDHAAVDFAQIHAAFFRQRDHIGQPQRRGSTGAEQGDRLPGQRDVFHELLELEQRASRPAEDAALFSAERMVGIDARGKDPVADDTHPAPLAHLSVSLKGLVGVLGAPQPGGHPLGPHPTAISLVVVSPGVGEGAGIA